MWTTASTATVLTPTAVALGNFDGVHQGHQQVIKPILKAAGAASELTAMPSLDAKATKGQAYATVATFEPHPREFFSGETWKLLTPRLEKVQLLKALGVEQLVLLPFDRELTSLSPEEFVKTILVQQMQVTRVSVGEDFRFGHRRAGTATDLQAIASTYGIDVTIISLQTFQGERISSSIIRQALSSGDIPQANRLLGRPYSLTGVVAQGQQLGRTIGFPTANLQLPSEKFLPRHGVYCGHVDGSALNSQAAVMNIGQRPTVDGLSMTIEVHLLDWSGDLYGQTLTISIEQFLRPEQKFASLDDLKTQIQADSAQARAILGTRN